MFTANASATFSATYSATSSGTGSGSGSTETEALAAANLAALTAAKNALITPLDESPGIEFSLSNTRLDFTNNIVNETYKLEPSGRWYSCCMSSSSQYQMAIQINADVYNSTDYGVTWVKVTTIDDSGFLSCSMSYDGKYRMVTSYPNNFVYISNDFGVTWSKVNIVNTSETRCGVSGDGKYMTFVTFFESDAGGKVWRSDDFGVTWSDVTPTFPDHPGFYYWVAISEDGKYQTLTITANSTSTGVTYDSSMVTSNDYGLTWNLIPLGINICSNAMSYDGKYQIAGDYGFENGIFTSSDYGVTWMPIEVESSRWIVGAISQDGKYQIYVSQNTPYIYASNDFGVTWSKGTFNARLAGVAISANGENLTIAPRNFKLQNSTDYGVTWSDNNNSPSLKAINDVSMSSSGQYQSSTIINGNIIRSSDYGKTWNNTSTINLWSSISLSLTGQYQIAGSYEKIVVSSDFGNTWKDVALIDFVASIVSISSSGQFQLYSDGSNIYASSDYGNTWNKSLSGLTGLFDMVISSSGKYQFACEYSGPKFSGGSIYASNNYGKDWREIPFTSPKNWNTISCSSNGKYLLAGTSFYGYATSSDYGNTWFFINDKNNYTSCSVSSTGQYQILKCSTNSTLYLSTDYGQTFSVLSEDDNYEIVCTSSTANLNVYYTSTSILQVETNAYVAK
jgi:photosystem II stability/assembly factor-like uncharacterized protein